MKNKAVEKPIFQIKSRFNPWVVAYSYPIRIIGTLLLLLFMMPELAKLFAFITGLGGFLSYLLSAITVALIAFCGPLLMTWLDYKVTTYSFYKDRIEFIDGFWVREKLTIRYKGFTKVVPKVNIIQKKYKLGNICLIAESKLIGAKTKEQGHELPNIYNPQKVIDNISKLLNSYNGRRLHDNGE